MAATIRFLVLGLVFLASGQSTQSKKILALEFFGSKSHVITYLPVLEELVRKGHQVTLLGPGKGLTKEKSIREIFTFDASVLMNGTGTDMFTRTETGEKVNPFTMLSQILPVHCRAVYDRPDIQALMTETFDLILFQPLFNDCALGLVYKIMRNNPSGTTPLVLFSPTSAPNFLVDYVGGHYPASFVSNVFLAYSDDMTFLQRFINLGSNLAMSGVFSWLYIPTMEAVYREKIGQDVPSVRELLGQASLLLANGHFSINRPKPNLPNVVDVGGIHSRKAGPLPKDLEDFIAKGGSDGFILFSLGSGLRAEQMKPEKRAIFFNVFSRLKQQVIWKYESEIPNLPKNVLLSKWLPQQDLLGHPRIKLFITHCGGGSNEEAIYHGTPLLGMPFFGDQPLNCQAAQNNGYLVRIDWNDLSEESLTSKIRELLDNPKYRENVKQLSAVFRDQVDNPLDRGVYWIEYIMRHNGAPHLQSPAKKLNFIQYHSLDVIAAYLAVIGGVSLIFVKLLQILLRCCGLCGGKSGQEAVKQKNKQKRS